MHVFYYIVNEDIEFYKENVNKIINYDIQRKSESLIQLVVTSLFLFQAV